MNCRAALLHTPWVVLTALLLAVTGCVSPQVRSQSDEETDREVKYDVKTVGDVTDVGNADPIPIGGVGIVVDLEGTGGPSPPSSYRTLLEDQLRKNRPLLDSLLKHHGVKDVKELLNLPSTSLVLVSGTIPPGAKKGDPLDIEVAVPPEGKATSLRGGRLVECPLFNYEYARNLSAKYSDSNTAIPGHKIARAEGALLVGFGTGDDAARLRQGRIWGGGHCNVDRPFHLVLKEKEQYASVASAAADRINTTFHGSLKGALGEQMAAAKNKSLVVLNVPHQYRLNVPRYLRVVRLIPLRETPDQVRVGADGEKRLSYRRCLEEDLLKPARTVTAALRLEALGHRSIDALKNGLTHEHPLVRFSSAEALTYLGSPSGAEELARMVEQHPALRAFSLTALASLDEAVCHVKLREMLSSLKPETRYGAFRALRALDDRDVCVQGDLLNDAFWLHRVAPSSPGLIHISSSRRAEIVLFGEEGLLKPPFAIRAGDFNVTAGETDDRCTVGLFSPTQGTARRKQCSLKVEEVLRTLAEMGGMYPEAAEVLRQAHSCKCLSCRLEVDQLPQAVSVQELARAGSGDPDSLLADQEILEARPDLGATPTLYESDAGKGRTDEDAEALYDHKPKKEKQSAERRSGAVK